MNIFTVPRNLHVMALCLRFTFTELRRHDKLYVIFQAFRSCYAMWRNTTSAWGATAVSSNTEGPIRVASGTWLPSINTTADVTQSACVRTLPVLLLNKELSEYRMLTG